MDLTLCNALARARRGGLRASAFDTYLATARGLERMRKPRTHHAVLCTAARIPLFLSKPGCLIGVRPLPLLPVPHSRRECPGGSEAVLPGSCHSAEFSSLVIITRALIIIRSYREMYAICLALEVPAVAAQMREIASAAVC